MAEERNLATVRATETTETEEVSKEELQRRMEEARESITQTVAEIKDTVTNQYQAVKESVTEALDWREQFRKRPLAFSIGALSVGLVVGYSLGGVFVGEADYDDEEDETRGLRSSASRSYAAQAITGGSYGSSEYQAASSAPASVPSAPPSPYAYSGSAATAAAAEADTGASSAEAEEPKGPGLIERFKGTKAYDRLEEEVSALGDRFLDELSKTAQTVVLPLLFNKVKDLFGVDLSGKKSEANASVQQQRSGGSASSGTSSAETGASLSGAAQSSFAGVNRSSAAAESGQAEPGGTTGNQGAGGSASSYATSENRGYGASASGGGGSDYTRGSD